MHLSKMRSLAVIVDKSLEHPVCERLSQVGAASYIVTESRASISGLSSKERQELKLVRIEAIVSEEQASEVIQQLQEEGIKEGTLSFFVSDVWANPQSVVEPHARTQKHAPREVQWGDYLITI